MRGRTAITVAARMTLQTTGSDHTAKPGPKGARAIGGEGNISGK